MQSHCETLASQQIVFNLRIHPFESFKEIGMYRRNLPHYCIDGAPMSASRCPSLEKKVATKNTY